MKKYLLLLVIFPSICFAGWTEQGEISSIYSHNGFIIIDSSVSSNLCGTNGKFWWPTSDDDSQELLSLALTAFTAGFKVQVVVNDTPASTDCLYGGNKMTHLKIFK